MPKVKSNDIQIDGLLWEEDFFRDEVVSWHRTNELGIGLGFTYSFLDRLPRDLNGDVDGFRVMTGGQREAVQSVLAMFESFIDVQFYETPEWAGYDIGFGTAALNPGALSTSGVSYNYIGYDTTAFGYFDKSEIFLTNDIRNENFEDPEPNDFSYLVIIHEIGHALGLEHPFEGIILPNALDSTRYTMMSYDDGFTQFEEPSTIMPLDVAALQYLYGANKSHNRGNTVYDLADYDAGSIQTIWDAGGTDTVSLKNIWREGPFETDDGNANYVDLSVGFDTGAKVYISGGLVLENVIGSDKRDWIIGNSADNSIMAGYGRDHVNTGAGDDTAFGGSGHDTLANPDGEGHLIGGSGRDTLIAYNGQSTLEGGTSNDILLGSRGDDALYGGAGSDFIVGETTTHFHGDDLIVGGRGNDKMMGAGGADTFVFATSDGNNVIGQFDLSSQSEQGADFTPGVDAVQLVGFSYNKRSDVLDDIRTVGDDAIFQSPDHSTQIRFVGLSADDFTPDSFVLTTDFD